MNKPYTKNMTRNLFLSLTVLLSSAAINAAELDFVQEIKIVAKKQSSDLKNKIASYMEDVKITQGSLVIEADLVQVSNDANSDSKTYIARGKPAKFSQVLDDGQKIELQANEISYSPTTNIIIIKGNAQVSQEGSMVKGDIITYNIATEQLSAESSEAVTTILKPDAKKTIEPNAVTKAEETKAEETKATETKAEVKQ